MKKKLMSGVVVMMLTALSGGLYFQRHRILQLEQEVLQANENGDDALRKRDSAERSRDGAVSRLKDVTEEASKLRGLLAEVTPPASDEVFENALDAWIGKVRRLADYLSGHPGIRIPQMDRLTASDWLDVVKDANGSLDTEADFREALGKLRGLARQKVAPEIGKALVEAIAQNNGKLPDDPRSLAPYLPAGFNPAILDEFLMNPSGEIPGLKTQQRFVLIDKRVDDLWDATMFYDTAGNWGLHSAFAKGKETVANAITQFTQSTGVPPTSPSQLLPYMGSGPKPTDESAFNELFSALTTRTGP